MALQVGEEQFRPHSRGLVHPQLETSPMEGLLPDRETTSEDDGEENVQDIYNTESSLSEYNPSAFFAPEQKQDSYLLQEINVQPIVTCTSPP